MAAIIWDPALRELTQPRRRRRRRRQQKPHKFAYLTVKNSIFARFARAFFIFDISLTFSFFLRREMTCFAVVWTTWQWWQMFNFVFLSVKRSFQINSRIVRTHFSSVMTLNNWEMITETRSDIFRWRSHCRRRRVCVNSLFSVSRLHRLPRANTKQKLTKRFVTEANYFLGIRGHCSLVVTALYLHRIVCVIFTLIIFFQFLWPVGELHSALINESIVRI